MKKRFLIIFICLLACKLLLAQQLTPFVISTSGGFYSTAEGMLSFTTGEMPVVETYANSLNILTQGFQQPWDFSTSITEFIHINLAAALYPNPSSGEINIITKAEAPFYIEVNIVDLLGRSILHKAYNHHGSTHSEQLDLFHASDGLYLMTLNVKSNPSSQVHSFISKFQIIR